MTTIARPTSKPLPAKQQRILQCCKAKETKIGYITFVDHAHFLLYLTRPVLLCWSYFVGLCIIPLFLLTQRAFSIRRLNFDVESVEKEYFDVEISTSIRRVENARWDLCGQIDDRNFVCFRSDPYPHTKQAN